jgi:hypothetical protein
MRRRGYQRHPRFTKRLEVTFSSGGLGYRGIMSNVSANGLFIRTNRGFAPGSIVDIELVMPDNRIALLRGVVKRTIKTPLSSMKNGMGVELLRQDPIFSDFIKNIGKNYEPASMHPATEFQVISCPSCGIKNKILSAKLDLGPKCGRCGRPLAIAAS